MTNREIKDLMRFFDSSDISKVKIKNGDFLIELQKDFDNQVPTSGTTTVISTPSQSVPVATQTQPQDEQSVTKEPVESIKSPMVGTFYQAPAPGADPFVKVGSVVKKGQTVGIVEAMKIMNEIEAEYDCKIVKILIEDGQPVEFDMPLFEVQKV